MKNTAKFVSLALAATVLATAAQANTITSTASATIVGPVTIAELQPMSFGSFGVGNVASRVSTGGTADAGISILTPGQPAKYRVISASSSYTLTGPISVTLNDGAGHSMTADIDTPFGVHTNVNGSENFDINGILNVPANQPAGSYTGTYALTVSY